MSRKLLALLITGSLVMVSGLVWAGWRYTKTPEYRVVYGTPEQQRWAIRLLVEEGADEGDWQQIQRCVKSPHDAVSLTAISAIGNARRTALAPLLIELLDSDRSLNIRLRILEALAQMGTPRAWDKVRSALTHDDHRIRQAAISHLARHGRRNAVPEIETCLEDEKHHVRTEAARALRELLHPEDEEPAEEEDATGCSAD